MSREMLSIVRSPERIFICIGFPNKVLTIVQILKTGRVGGAGAARAECVCRHVISSLR